MPERPFQCTPTSWNRDPVLNSVSWEAELLFRRISLECDRHWRIAVDAENIAHSVRCRCFEPQRRFESWKLPKVARYLDEIMAAGIVRRLLQAERCWLEVGQWLQYAKGEIVGAAPETAQQVEMPMLVGMEPVQHSIERRVDGEKIRTSTRAVAAEKELLAELGQILCAREMMQNGGAWRLRIRENPRAVRNAIEDWKVRTPDQRRAIRNVAAWLTDRHAWMKQAAA